MKLRSIRHRATAQRVSMGDIFVHQAIPLPGIDQVDPVLLIHHWADRLPGGKHPSQVGVGPHPHRGFAPVTLVFKGSVHHRDSLGNDAIVGPDGTQWMHSGSGLVHSERPDRSLAEQGGDFELIQFWVNVPASKKMVPPEYRALQASETPWVQLADGKVGVVCGAFGGRQGAIDPPTPMDVLRFDLEAGARVQVPLPAGHNDLLYVLDGEFVVNGAHAAGAKDMLVFAPEGEGFELEARSAGRAIVLGGRPIQEPIATYGPFVMNTQEEIRTALRDYQLGRMGQLIESFD